MNDLTDFLLARIGEDLETAVAASERGKDWSMDDGPNDGRLLTVAEIAHLVRFDPAAIARDCEAKRRIVERMVGEVADEPHYCRCFSCLTLVDLALPYADHPDYRQEWKP